MNKLIIGLVALLGVIVLLMVALIVMNATQPEFYDTVEHVKYDQILDEKEGNHLYYYYQVDCPHCQELKPAIKKFSNELETTSDIDLTFVDMEAKENKEGWTNDPNYNTSPLFMSSIDDIKITGTPAMIWVEDGSVIQYEVGNPDIESLIEKVKTQFLI